MQSQTKMKNCRQRLNETLRALDRVAVEAAKKFAPTLSDPGISSSGSEKALQQLQQQQANGAGIALTLQSFQSLHSLCGAAAAFGVGGGSSGGALAGSGSPNVMSMSMSLTSSGAASGSGACLTPGEQSLLSLQSPPAPPDLIPASATTTRQNSVEQFQQQQQQQNSSLAMAALAPLKHGDLSKIVGEIREAGPPSLDLSVSLSMPMTVFNPFPPILIYSALLYSILFSRHTTCTCTLQTTLHYIRVAERRSHIRVSTAHFRLVLKLLICIYMYLLTTSPPYAVSLRAAPRLKRLHNNIYEYIVNTEYARFDWIRLLIGR